MASNHPKRQGENLEGASLEGEGLEGNCKKNQPAPKTIAFK